MNKLYSSILGAIVALGVVGSSGDAHAWGPNNGCCQPDCCVVDNCNDDCGCNWWVEAEVIAWVRDTRDTDYAVEIPTVGSLANSKVHYLGQEWEPGFRLGLGYHLPCDCWDAKLVWTYWNNSEKDTVDYTGLTTPRLLPIQTHPVLVAGNNFQRVAASRSTKYNVVDGLIGRSLCVNECFTLNPFFGIRGLFLNQNKKAYFSGNSATSGINGDVYSKWESDYQAGGFHAGFEGRYQLNCNWNIFAKVAGSIVAGEDDASIHQFNSAGTLTFVTVDDDTDLLIASNGEASLGIGYDFCLCNRVVSLAVGYEFVHWWNTPEQRRFYNGTSLATSGGQSNGSIGFHGAFFRIATNW